MSLIEMEGITKDYGGGRGIFDVDLRVEKGEVYGFLGPNGAGKTTSIRHLMGFIRPDRGSCRIGGLDCFACSAQIQKKLGYLAGEIAFLEDLSGRKLLEFLMKMKGMKGPGRSEELMERFELNPDSPVRKMSKGMKQKVGIVAAFMDSPEILILDEPTSGLDPLMQNRFIELIREEKKKGTTVLMSSHMFEEIERTCDRTAIIRQGRIASVEKMEELAARKQKNYVITLDTPESAAQVRIPGFPVVKQEGAQITIASSGQLPELLAALSRLPVRDLDVKAQTLEELFLHFYGEEGKNNE
jgi:ABC-2 type transport system ATP-binding protein